jgi:hypothetical protein
VQVAQSKKDKRDKEAAEAAAKKAADDWTAKVAADKALSDRRKTAAAAGPEALAAFEAELAAEAERKKWTADDEKAYWAEIKRINDERKAEAAAEAKRRKVGVVGATLLSPLPSPRRPASPPPRPALGTFIYVLRLAAERRACCCRCWQAGWDGAAPVSCVGTDYRCTPSVPFSSVLHTGAEQGGACS